MNLKWFVKEKHFYIIWIALIVLSFFFDLGYFSSTTPGGIVLTFFLAIVITGIIDASIVFLNKFKK